MAVLANPDVVIGSEVAWEEVRDRGCDAGWEKFYVYAVRTKEGWEFKDQSDHEQQKYDLPPEPDLVKIAEEAFLVPLDQKTWQNWADIAPDTLKERAQRNRCIVRRLKFRYRWCG